MTPCDTVKVITHWPALIPAIIRAGHTPVLAVPPPPEHTSMLRAALEPAPPNEPLPAPTPARWSDAP